MISFERAARNIDGAWRMAMGLPDWRERLDRSVEGVFQSFWAFAFAIPMRLAVLVAARRAFASEPELAASPLAVFAPIEIIALGVSWAASLAVLLIVARTVGASARAVDLIVGYNWMQVIALAGYMVPAALFALTGSADIFMAANFPALIFAVVLLWGVLRQGMGLDVGLSVALLGLVALVELVTSAATTGALLALHGALS